MIRRRSFSAGVWLGLFAMLMIHAGPLYSAWQASSPQVTLADEHAHHAHHGEHAQAASAHGHHRQASAAAPAWLAALEMCGYCELLTLSPPLNVSVVLTLPFYAATFAQPLPERPLPPAPRRGAGHPRAPPILHS